MESGLTRTAFVCRDAQRGRSVHFTWVYLGKIPTTLKIQSVSFAGPNKEYLYMIAARGLWRAKMIAHGYMARAK